MFKIWTWGFFIWFGCVEVGEKEENELIITNLDLNHNSYCYCCYCCCCKILDKCLQTQPVRPITIFLYILLNHPLSQTLNSQLLGQHHQWVQVLRIKFTLSQLYKTSWRSSSHCTGSFLSRVVLCRIYLKKELTALRTALWTSICCLSLQTRVTSDNSGSSFLLMWI